MKKVFFIVSVLALLVSCNNESKTSSKITVKDGEVSSKLSSGNESADELKAQAEEREKEREQREKERLASMTSMEITPSVHDFGSIPKEKPVTTYFKIKNTGENPLIINETEASCGCTVPQKPEAPIMPGDTYDLEVTFTSNESQAGTAINKTITVTANVPEASQVVSIKGQVQP